MIETGAKYSTVWLEVVGSFARQQSGVVRVGLLAWSLSPHQSYFSALVKQATERSQTCKLSINSSPELLALAKMKAVVVIVLRRKYFH